jgi:CBS domain containing-hemolysin-like protein
MQALLDELQEARVHLAVVLDRLGRYEGIVTMEDVLEEIVGELHDEREREAAQ